MSLRSRGSRKPTKVGNFGKNGANSVPVNTTLPYPEKELEFKNAIATTEDDVVINSGVAEATLSQIQFTDLQTWAHVFESSSSFRPSNDGYWSYYSFILR
jgi:hypothetical protein